MFSCVRPFASEPWGKRASPVDRQEIARRSPGDYQELRREPVCDSTAVGTQTLKRVRDSTTVGTRICDPTAVGTQTLKRVCDSTAVGTHVVLNLYLYFHEAVRHSLCFVSGTSPRTRKNFHKGMFQAVPLART